MNLYKEGASAETAMQVVNKEESEFVPQRRGTLQIGALQRAGELHIVVGQQAAAVLAPGALGKGDPILRRELGELRAEEPAQDVTTLGEIARNGELSHAALDPQQTLRLDDGTNVVEDDA